MKKTRIALLLALLLSLSACGTAASDSPMLAADSSVSAGAADASKEDATPAADSGDAAASADDVPASEADADDAPAPEGAETAETESALLTPGNVVKSETERIANAVADQVPQVETSAVEQSVEADDGTQVMRYEGLEFTVTLPAHPDIAELIQADLNGAAALETDEQLEEQALEDYQYALDENLDWIAYCDELSVQVVRADEHVLSLRLLSYSYTGGVHGYYRSYGVSYDVQTGQRLTLKNISAEGADFAVFARNSIVELCEQEEYKDLLFNDWRSYVGGVVQDSNFFFTDEGITFVSAPYLLGPYAAGEIEFPISYTDLAGVVRDRYLK